MFKYDTIIFIHKSRLKHNNKYIYTLTIYRNAHTPVIITCPIHGNFEEQPYNHYFLGWGCPHCEEEARLALIENKKIIFSEKIYIKYGDLYSYDLSNFINFESVIDITCLTHNVTFSCKAREFLNSDKYKKLCLKCFPKIKPKKKVIKIKKEKIIKPKKEKIVKVKIIKKKVIKQNPDLKLRKRKRIIMLKK